MRIPGKAKGIPGSAAEKSGGRTCLTGAFPNQGRIARPWKDWSRGMHWSRRHGLPAIPAARMPLDWRKVCE
jgi:hypothetical protein